MSDKYGIPGAKRVGNGYEREVGSALVVNRYEPPIARHRTHRNIADRSRVTGDFARVLSAGQGTASCSTGTATAGNSFLYFAGALGAYRDSGISFTNTASAAYIPDYDITDNRILVCQAWVDDIDLPEGLVLATLGARFTAIKRADSSTLTDTMSGPATVGGFALGVRVVAFNATASDITVTSKSLKLRWTITDVFNSAISSERWGRPR